MKKILFACICLLSISHGSDTAKQASCSTVPENECLQNAYRKSRLPRKSRPIISIPCGEFIKVPIGVINDDGDYIHFASLVIGRYEEVEYDDFFCMMSKK